MKVKLKASLDVAADLKVQTRKANKLKTRSSKKRMMMEPKNLPVPKDVVVTESQLTQMLLVKSAPKLKAVTKTTTNANQKVKITSNPNSKVERQPER
jgi:hypothetical protein